MESSTQEIFGVMNYRKTKYMETCQDNQKFYQLTLNLPEINVQKMSLIRLLLWFQSSINAGR